jgi:hypothetical protein
VGVHSIGAAVQIRDVAGDHLFVAAGKMAFGKVDRVGKLHHMPEKIRTLPEAFQDAGHFQKMKDASEHRLRIISGSRPVANSRSKDDQGVTKKDSRLESVVVEVVNCNRPVLAPTGTSALT